MGVMTFLVGVVGVAPGVGKTTLAANLCAWLGDRGLDCDLVEEDELYTRQELAPIARELAVQETVTPETLVTTMGDFVDSSADGSAIVMDGLFPFVSWFRDWGYGEHRIAGFFVDAAARLAGHRVLVIYLDANVGVALRLAADREPPGWLEWYVERLARTKPGPSLSDFEQAVDRLERKRALTLSLVGEQGWQLVTVADVNRLSTAGVLELVTSTLEERGLVAG